MSDSTLLPTYGNQESAAFNYHYQANGYHPLLCFDGMTGNLLKAELRPGAMYCSNAPPPRRAEEQRKHYRNIGMKYKPRQTITTQNTQIKAMKPQTSFSFMPTTDSAGMTYSGCSRLVHSSP